jgi:hypothetical protein
MATSIGTIYQGFTNKQLRAQLKKFSLPVSGNKSDMVARLVNHAEHYFGTGSDDAPADDHDSFNTNDVVEKQLDKFRTQAKINKARLDALETELELLKKEREIEQLQVSKAGVHQDQEVTPALVEAITASRIAVPEPFVYDGDPLRYNAWKAAFNALIERKGIPKEDRIYHLQKYLKGRALTLVENLFMIESPNAYDEARALLHKRFGDSFKITEAFRTKLESWPKIGSDDRDALQEYSDFINQCLTAKKHTRGLEILDDCRENQKMLEVLPNWVVRKWAKRIVDHKRNHDSFPDFEVFCRFIEDLAEVACEPVTSMRGSSSHKPSNSSKSQPKFPKSTLKPSVTLVSQTSQQAKPASPICPSHSNSSSSSQPRVPSKVQSRSCAYCKHDNHELDFCFSFLRKPWSERHEFIKDSKLCFGCLKLAGHRSKQCSDRLTCRTCGKSHPTSLHKAQPDTTTMAASSSNSSADSSKNANTSMVSAIAHNSASISDRCRLSTSILPVYVFSTDCPENKVLVYALLDSMSDICFVSTDVLSQVDSSSASVTIKLATMTSSCSSISCKKSDKLLVQSFYGGPAIQLPSTFSRDYIPAERSHIPTPDKALRCSHLKDIASEIPVEQQCEVGLLIGYNCPQVFIPRSVISGLDHEPFAIKSDLGWSIFGKTGSQACSDAVVTSHRIVTLPDNDDSSRSIVFALNSSVKEISSDNVVEALESDFVEKHCEEKLLSQDDILFMSILDKGAFQEDSSHYSMPLPFKTRPCLPDNRKVAPRKSFTIPRLELQAAVLSARIASMILRELSHPHIKLFLWTDSAIVLGYIHNQAKRFHTYVANRVQTIRNLSQPNEWYHVKSELNPADIGSRGCRVEDLESQWLKPPLMLLEHELPIESAKRFSVELAESDPEVKQNIVLLSQPSTDRGYVLILKLIEKFSSWEKAVNLISFFTSKAMKVKQKPHSLVEAKLKAVQAIIRAVQHEVYASELSRLENSECVLSSSSLVNLDPFLDRDGLIRVGGRLGLSDLEYSQKHPVVLPKSHHVSQLVIGYYHKLVAHQGRGLTINSIRSNGFWIVCCSKAVSSFIHHCVTCRKQRGKVMGQKMSAIPPERTETNPPFTVCGMDCFGPFHVTEYRRQKKVYGIIFTCFALRAVHIELVSDLSTDSFINALRCFIAVRGNVQEMHCDRGSNFVGGCKELHDALHSIQDSEVRAAFAKYNCNFTFNTPTASHMGGIWESLIRPVRSILNNLVQNSGVRLTSEELRTLFYETMAIINSRPLTVQNLNDVNSLEPLTPNHLLTMKSEVVLPPGNFCSADMYCRKRWKKVQCLANQFWTRWRKEYLITLQQRHKWHKPKCNIKLGAVVLIVDENSHRSEWKIG